MDAVIDVMDADSATPYVCLADSSESQESECSGSLGTDGGLLMLLFNQHDEPDADFVHEMERLAALVADVERIHRGVPPEVLAGEDAPILDRWILAKRMVPCLAGLSTGHPLLPGTGRPIGTSDLWLLSKDHGWARTLSRWYRLGRPAERSGLNG
jgi:hypothetical protein